jgi:hypothetical protein
MDKMHRSSFPIKWEQTNRTGMHHQIHRGALGSHGLQTDLPKQHMSR